MSVSGREKPAAEEATVAGSVSCGTNGHQSFLAQGSPGIKLQERRVAVVSSHCISRWGEKKWSLNEEGCVVQTFMLWKLPLLLTKTGHQQSPNSCLSTQNTRQASCQRQAVHRNCIFGHNSAMLTMYLFTPKRKIRFLEELSTFFTLQ